MLKIGDRVEYWYRMGRHGTLVRVEQDPANQVWLEGGTPANALKMIVLFDDGAEEAYPAGDLRKVEQ
jgi:hypothetical protein